MAFAAMGESLHEVTPSLLLFAEVAGYHRSYCMKRSLQAPTQRRMLK
jgi:hypothetical protein